MTKVVHRQTDHVPAGPCPMVEQGVTAFSGRMADHLASL